MRKGYLAVILGAVGVAAAATFRFGKKPIAPKLPALLIGDNLGIGLSTYLPPAGLPIRSIASSGTMVTNWVTSHKAMLVASLTHQPGSVFVSLGANDAYLDDTYAKTTASATAALLSLIADAGAQVFWIGPPRLPAFFAGRPMSQAVLDAIRTAVEATPNATWIDSTAMAIPRDPGGLQPTDAGYAYWADLLLDQLGMSFVSPSPSGSTSVTSSTVLSGDETEEPEPSPRPPPPSVVKMPIGWGYATKASRAAALFAVSVLAKRHPIGELETATIEGSRLGFLTEWHWDNHVDHTWKWHRGISILIPVQ